MKNKPELWMGMIDTADIVAKRYSVCREAQDEYALHSQQRTAAAQEAGYFSDEIVPLTTVKEVKDKETGEILEEEVTLKKDEGNRPGTTLEGLMGLRHADWSPSVSSRDLPLPGASRTRWGSVRYLRYRGFSNDSV